MNKGKERKEVDKEIKREYMGYKSEVRVIGAELALGRVVEVKFSRGSRVAFCIDRYHR